MYLAAGDVLIVYDGESFMDASVRTLRGSLTQSVSSDFVMSTTGNLYITLQTDSSQINKGFSFNLRSSQYISVYLLHHWYN